MILKVEPEDDVSAPVESKLSFYVCVWKQRNLPANFFMTILNESLRCEIQSPTKDKISTKNVKCERTKICHIHFPVFRCTWSRNTYLSTWDFALHSSLMAHLVIIMARHWLPMETLGKNTFNLTHAHQASYPPSKYQTYRISNWTCEINRYIRTYPY